MNCDDPCCKEAAGNPEQADDVPAKPAGCRVTCVNNTVVWVDQMGSYFSLQVQVAAELLETIECLLYHVEGKKKTELGCILVTGIWGSRVSQGHCWGGSDAKGDTPQDVR